MTAAAVDGEVLTIDGRYCGPPGSANGGYACGSIALLLTEEPAEVTLRRPPPLDVPMAVERSPGEVAVSIDGEVVGVARPSTDVAPPAAAVGLEESRRAAAAFDLDAYASTHAFPTCFTCGPDRAEGDGLRCFPAPIEHEGATVAWPWIPAPSVDAGDGLVDARVVWAALDCPSGLSWYAGEELMEPIVLGRMAVDLRRRPAIGEPAVVVGWPGAADGRKRHAGAAVWSAGGELLAVSATTWFVLTPEQQAAFGSAV